MGLDTSRVQIRRNEQGDLVIKPLPADRGTALLQALQGFDNGLADDFVSRLVEDRRERAPAQERDPL